MRKTLIVAAALLWALPVQAEKRRRVEVPVNVGLGPSAFFVSGPVFRDQPVHLGLKLDVYALIDRALIEANQDRIPRQYRKLARGITEVRISPSLFIPDSLILSPAVRNTGLYGITWRPLSLGFPVGQGPVRLRVGAGLLLTYAFLHSRVLPTTHFLRPGVDLRAVLEMQMSSRFVLSLGWSSGVYIPQGLGTFGTAPLDSAIWHLGQAFLLFNVRFPYQTSF